MIEPNLQIIEVKNNITKLIYSIKLRYQQKDGSYDIPDKHLKTVKDLKETIESIGDAHHWKTNIVAKSKIKESDFVWFDMRSYDDEYEIPQNFRFQYKYGTPSQIVNGLKTFSDAITFFKNKPAKENKIERKQKRNDI